MSAAPEREALGHPVSLFEHAERLSRLTPEGPLPDGGRPFSDGDPPPKLTRSKRRTLLPQVIREFLDDPRLSGEDLHERCS